MVHIVCFDVLAIIRFLKHDRYSREVIKPFKHSVVMLAIFIGWKLYLSDSYNMGTSDLPNMYAQSPRAEGIHIGQITSAHVTTTI